MSVLTHFDVHPLTLLNLAFRRLALARQRTPQLMALLQQNTELPWLAQQLNQRIEALTAEMHG